MNRAQKSIYLLCFSILLFSSCKGQVKTELTENKITSKDKEGGTLKIKKTQNSDAYQNIGCGLQDRADNLWFGSSGEGVYRYDGKLFTQFTTKNGLKSNAVRAMLEDKKGNIWIATSNGICYYDGKMMHQISKSVDATYQFSYSNNISFSIKSDVFSIMQDQKGLLYFGTEDGVICFDGNKFTNFMDKEGIINDSNLTLKSVHSMIEDKDGNIGFGSGPMAFEGLCKYNGKSLTKYTPLNQIWIRKIHFDRNGRLLFLTRAAGTITFDGKKFVSIPVAIKLNNSILPGLFIDSKGNSWYSTDYVDDADIKTGGLWKYDGATTTEYTKKNGLSNTAVIFILEDRAENIWIGTRDNGLYKYDGENFTIYSE